MWRTNRRYSTVLGLVLGREVRLFQFLVDGYLQSAIAFRPDTPAIAANGNWISGGRVGTAGRGVVPVAWSISKPGSIRVCIHENLLSAQYLSGSDRLIAVNEFSH